MRKRVLKKSEVIREGYLNGLRKASKILNEMLEPSSKKQMDDMIEHIYNQDMRACMYMIKNGFNVNTTDENGQTMLHWACKENWEDMVLYLCTETNIDILKRDKRGDMAIQVAAAHARNYQILIDIMCENIRH